MQNDFPDILQKLNGTTQQRLAIIETLSLKAGREQVPVLVRLVDAGPPEVQAKALENLLLWQDPRSKPALERLLTTAPPRLQIMAIKGLAALGEYSAILQPQIVNADATRVRLAVIEVIGRACRPRTHSLVSNGSCRPGTSRKGAWQTIIARYHTPRKYYRYYYRVFWTKNARFIFTPALSNCWKS